MAVIKNTHRTLKIQQLENKQPDFKNGLKTLTDTSSKKIHPWQIII